MGVSGYVRVGFDRDKVDLLVRVDMSASVVNLAQEMDRRGRKIDITNKKEHGNAFKMFFYLFDYVCLDG